MKRHKLFGLTLLICFVGLLSSCTNGSKSNTRPAKKAIVNLQRDETIKKDNQVRLKFNDIKTATAANDFKGGSTLENIISMYGKPNSHKKQKSGNVTLDVYNWNLKGIQINIQLLDDSTIARSISNFSFERKQTITKEIYDRQLPEGIDFKKAVEVLGQPDVMSQAVSSDSEEIQAVWTSNLKGTNHGRQLQLIFTNNKLSKKTQNGLV